MGKRTREAARAERAPPVSPEAVAHHECGHAVVGWLYGPGFVGDVVAEWFPTARAGIHGRTYLTGPWRAPTGVVLTRLDVGAMRRLAVVALAGPVAEGLHLVAEGRKAVSVAALSRGVDSGAALDLTAAAALIAAALRAGVRPVVLPVDWFARVVQPALLDARARRRLSERVAAVAVTAERLLTVPAVAAAHRRCVEAMLPTGALTRADLAMACAPLARLRQPPTVPCGGAGRL